MRIFVSMILIAAWTWGVYLVGRQGIGSGGVDSSESGRPQTEYEAMQRKESGAAGTPKLQLHIKDIAIIPGEKEGSYKYKVTVEPLIGKDGVAAGMLKLIVSGEKDGEEQVIEIPDTKNELENGYRPFSLSQDLVGDVAVPEGFKPDRVALELFTGEDTANPLIHKYSWTDVLSEQKQEEVKVNENEKALADLERENLALKIKLAKAESAAESAQSGGADASGQGGDGIVQGLKQERDAMAKELEQLKEKISDLRGKVEIKTVSLSPKGGGGEVEFYVSVGRTVQDGDRLTGIMQISLIGTEDDQQKVYTQEQITSDKKARYRLGFRNFQEIKESIFIPKGFTPEKMTIQIVPENEGMKELNEVYEWKKLTGES